MTRDKYKKAYTQHKSNAKTRGIEFKLTFDEWKQIWLDSGKWDERGRGAEKYCMCRVGDIGCYEVGNVFIGLGKTNVRDGNLGKIDSQETKHKKSVAAKGKPKPWFFGDKNPMHRLEVKAKMSIAVGGSNNYKAKTVISPFGIFGSATEASKELNIPAVTIQWRCRNNKTGWSYLAIA
jgi:hypothetical protein